MITIATDFCEIKLSKKTIAWLNNLDPNWEVMVFKKRKGKKALYVRQRFKELECAANILAAIEFYSGGFLEEI